MAKNPPKPKPVRNAQRHKQRGLLTLTGYDDTQDLHRPPVIQIKPLEPRTQAQADYIAAISANTLTFAIGPMGTGKTFIAAACAAEALMAGEVDKILVTRPAVEAEEELGFLPGDLGEKFAPWFAPFRIELEKRLGKSQVEMFLKNGRIEVLPLAYMRGHTFERAFVVLDEAQNTTPSQMKLFLTRVGENSKIVVDGDLGQKDIKGPSGLADALKRLEGRQSIACIEFELSDIVRSGICREIAEAYAA